MKYILTLLVLVLVSCNNKTATKKLNQPIVKNDTIEIIVERGAFHNDTFILKDNLLTFYPAKKKFGFDNTDYTTKSSQIITTKSKDSLVKHIIDNGFFKLKDNYTNSTSCDSYLAVTVTYGAKTKKVISEDYIQGCPTLLSYIENEIIRLHTKNLKRSLLPG